MKNITAIGALSLLLLASSPALAAQNKNQVQTKNMGEDTQLMINTQEQDRESLGASQENMSPVAKAVQEFLQDDTIESGIGQQVREIAREQRQSQEDVRGELNKIRNQNQIMKILVGPDYKTLKTLQKKIEQNRLRIQELTELEGQLTDPEEIKAVAEMTALLEQENASLQDSIVAEENTFSLIGWIKRMFAR